MSDPNDHSKINLGGGTASPTVQVEIMPTGVMYPSTRAQVVSGSGTPEDGPIQLFRRCFEVPLETLRSLPNGDGGFAALIVACPLYERYVGHVRRRSTDQDVADQLVADFGLSRVDAQTVWDVVRHGLLHSAMVKAHTGPIDRSWVIHHGFPRPFAIDRSTTPPTLRIQPWRFVDYVLDVYRRQPEIVTAFGDWPQILAELA